MSQDSHERANPESERPGLAPAGKEEAVGPQPSSWEGFLDAGRLTFQQVGDASFECLITDNQARTLGTAHEERFGRTRKLAAHVWMGMQFRKAGKLDANRVSRLEMLAGWTWDLLADTWEEGFAHLLKYVKRTGNSDVPDDYVDDDGFRLGQWTGRRRVDRLHGKLDPERESRLEAVSGWQWHRRDALWDERLAYLQRFAEREGHARVPQSYIEGGFKLGRWVLNQRVFRTRGWLDAEKKSPP